MSVVPLPTLRTTSPLLPAVAAPVENNSLPLDPEDVVPVLNVIIPVVPILPELTDRITIDPDESVLPVPDAIESRPPVRGWLMPLETVTSPPESVLLS